MAMTEHPDGMFEDYTPAMVLAFVFEQMGEEGLVEFLDRLCNPSDEMILREGPYWLGTVTPHDVERIKGRPEPLDRYEAELREMGLNAAADIVQQAAN
jgi:hypothetical protein